MSESRDLTDSQSLVRMQACAAGHYESFAELTAVVISQRFMRVGRPFDALRILRGYLRQYPITAKISAQLQALAV